MIAVESGTLYSELAAYDATFRANREVAERMAATLTPVQFNWRSAPDRWSIAQCLAHLNVSGELYAARIEEAVRRARAAGQFAAGPFRYGALSRWMLHAVDPATRQRQKTPAKFAPAPIDTFVVRDVLDAFRALGSRWERCLRDANGLDLARVKVRSPALPVLRFSLGAAFAIEAAHEQRHLRQADDVLALQAGRS